MKIALWLLGCFTSFGVLAFMTWQRFKQADEYYKYWQKQRELEDRDNERLED